MTERPSLQTPRLWLRPFALSDAPAVQRLAGDRAIADTTLNVPHPYLDGMAEQWIATHAPAFEAGELANFAIVLRTDDALVGAIGLTIDAPCNRAELGYWIGKPYWGNGYCTEAASAIVRFGFGTMGLNRIHASWLSRNPASGRVLNKIGMRHEGCARQHTRRWGRYEDLELCALLRQDWAAQDAG